MILHILTLALRPSLYQRRILGETPKVLTVGCGDRRRCVTAENIVAAAGCEQQRNAYARSHVTSSASAPARSLVGPTFCSCALFGAQLYHCALFGAQ